jgi:tetratricopeptide (TPR) repeat protein
MVTVMEPGNVNAFYGLGNAHSKVGNQDRAIAAYQAALELKPDFHGASFGWALALQKEGDYEAAIERYELTLELEETYSSYVNMAICYKALGDEETSDEYYALADELKKKGR